MIILRSSVLGYTLTELLIALTIGTFATTYVFGSIKDSATWHTQSRSVITTIKTARAQAASLNQPVILCSLDAELACTNVASPLTTFADINNNKKYDADDVWLGELELDSIELKWRQDRRFIRFRPDATVWGYFGTLRLCANNDKRMAITISATGRNRVFTPPAEECLPD